MCVDVCRKMKTWELSVGREEGVRNMSLADRSLPCARSIYLGPPTYRPSGFFSLSPSLSRGLPSQISTTYNVDIHCLSVAPPLSRLPPQMLRLHRLLRNSATFTTCDESLPLNRQVDSLLPISSTLVRDIQHKQGVMPAIEMVGAKV